MSNLKKAGKVILWLLFWYYLIPYYLLKKYVFKHSKRNRLWSSLSSIVIVFVLFCCWANSLPDDSSTSTSKPKVHYVVKEVGKKELAKAQAKEKVLDKEERKEKAEYEKLEAALVVAKKKAQKQKQTEEKAEKEVAEEKENNSSSSTSSRSANTSQHHSSGTPAGNHGDMNTADSGKIIGNRNSKIYHVPGQAGYRMQFTLIPKQKQKPLVIERH